MFLQALCEEVVKFARASTAEGENLDSWCADFDFYRLPASKAKGQVRFSLSIAKDNQTLIPIGSIIQVSGGAIQYQVVADDLQTAWNEIAQAYIIPAGQTSCIATVEALNAGYAYNVQPDQLTKKVSTLTGVDAVTNIFAITNGLDAESDADFRNRFILYINSLSKNTRPSISSAVMSVQQGINFNLVENKDQNGNDRNGFFTVVVDDGSGSPSPELLDKVVKAVETVRGFTIAYTVVAAAMVSVTATLNVKSAPGSNATQVQTNVQKAIVAYINSLKIGESLYVYKLIQIAYSADPNVVAVQVNSAKIDNAELDRTITEYQVIRTVPASVTVGGF